MANQYDDETPYGARNLYQVFLKRIRVESCIVADDKFAGHWQEEHLQRSTESLRVGSVKASTTEVIGVERAPEGFVGMLNGQRMGRLC